VSLVPQFDTERDSLAIHPDGNIEGSLGCIVFPFESLDENIRCRNILRDLLEHGTVKLSVAQLSLPQGA